MYASTSSTFTTPSYSLQIKRISAESLTMASRKPVRKNLSVTISTREHLNDGDYRAHSFENRASISTRVCEEGHGCMVAWQEELEMDVPMHVKYISLDVRYLTRSGNKSIGVANVPMSDFVGGSLPSDYLHCLSYRLRDGDGNPNGIINFSIKVVNYSKGFDYLKGGYGKNNNDIMYSYNDNRLNVQKLGYGVSRNDCWGRNNGDNHAVVGVPVSWYSK